MINLLPLPTEIIDNNDHRFKVEKKCLLISTKKVICERATPSCLFLRCPDSCALSGYWLPWHMNPDRDFECNFFIDVEVFFLSTLYFLKLHSFLYKIVQIPSSNSYRFMNTRSLKKKSSFFVRVLAPPPYQVLSMIIDFYLHMYM